MFDWSSIRIDKDHRIDFVSADLKHLHGGCRCKKRSLEEALLIRHRQREMSQLKQLPESAPSITCRRLILRPWELRDEREYISLFRKTEIRRGHGLPTAREGVLSERFHQMIHPPSSSRDACWSWAVMLNEGAQRPQIIGHIDAWLAPTLEPCLTVAYGLAPTFWSQGLWPRVGALVDMQSGWGIPSFRLRCCPQPEVKLLFSLGFEPVGEMPVRGRLVCHYRCRCYRRPATRSARPGVPLVFED